ncbi:MAG: hypothetical protein ACOCYT_02555 [Chloroflexota bacterium]
MSYQPIRYPSHATFLSLESLFDLRADNASGQPCQQAIQEILRGLPELGIGPLETIPYVLTFPSLETRETFLDLLRETDCGLRPSIPEAGFGLRETVRQPVTGTATYTSPAGARATVTLTLEPAPGSGVVTFENRAPFSTMTRELLDLIYLRVGMAGAHGPTGYPLTNLIVALDTLNVEATQPQQRPAPQPVTSTPPTQKKKDGNPFFRAFDWVFDTIDKMFAGGSGDTFSNMGTTPERSSVNAPREAIWYAVAEAMNDALLQARVLVEPVTRVEVRFPVEDHEAVAAAFRARGGTIEDETHDGTRWTLSGTIAARALADFSDDLISASDATATVRTLADVRFEPVN